MHIVPLISIKKGLLYDGTEGITLSIEDLFTRVEKDTMLYVLDYDGIEHNNPNFELYQRLTEHCVLWIDDGPRRLDDVMDTIMAGATNITLRAALWPDADIPGVLELTDDEIFFMLPFENHEQISRIPFMQNTIGAVLFETGHQNIGDFTSNSTIKGFAAKHKIYLYTDQSKNHSHLEELGLTGMVVDLSRKEGNIVGL